MEIAKDWSVLPEDHAETVIYGMRDGTPLRMLVMKPEGMFVPAPCMVFIHGGGFTGGSAEMLLPQCRYFVQRGFVCVSVDYRLMKTGEDGSPLPGEAQLADIVADCKAAVRYVRRHARDWNGDPERIVLAGESAGGYLACAVTALRHVEETEADLAVSCVPELLVVYNPITQLMCKWKMRVEHATGGQAAGTPGEEWQARHRRARLLSPLFHLSEGHPVTLVIHGLDDTVVPPEDSADYAEGLRERGVETGLILLPGSKHAFALTNYTAPDDVVEHTLQLTADFLGTHGFLP